jgi:hypothetical protein
MAMKTRRTLRRLGPSAVLALGLAIPLAPGVAAAVDEPNGHASCMGIELAAISPPGSSDEVPGGAAAFVVEVKSIATSLGVSPGAVSAFIASLHAGSHAECDEALEE